MAIFKPMFQQEFAHKAIAVLKEDPAIIGIAAAGSWITKELDAYSDLDLVIVTREKIGGNKDQMQQYAKQLGEFISGFTGEHVGETRLLICLFNNPLLHVDLKFVTLDEFAQRVENPAILFERDDQLSKQIRSHPSHWPQAELQWIEDRFWTWIHYCATKLGRGEYFEVLNALEMLRLYVLAPLLQRRNNLPVRGLRKVEKLLPSSDLGKLQSTVAGYDPASLFLALENAVGLYRELRQELHTVTQNWQHLAEEKSIAYLKEIKQKAGYF